MTTLLCAHCSSAFVRKTNTRFCCDGCRFDSRVKIQDDDCWIWTGTLNASGYGIFFLNHGNRLAHRVAFKAAGRAIPPGYTLDHLCRVRSCVNPAHLEPVTRAVNTLRGVAPTVRLYWRNQCKYGHEFTPENTYYFLGGKRRACRICIKRRDSQRARNRATSAVLGEAS